MPAAKQRLSASPQTWNVVELFGTKTNNQDGDERPLIPRQPIKRATDGNKKNLKKEKDKKDDAKGTTSLSGGQKNHKNVKIKTKKNK